jgi:DNA-binding NtrC family response regulator
MKITVIAGREDKDCILERLVKKSRQITFFDINLNDAFTVSELNDFDVILVCTKEHPESAFKFIERLKILRPSKTTIALINENASENVILNVMNMEIYDYFMMPRDLDRLAWKIDQLERIQESVEIIKSLPKNNQSGFHIIGESNSIESVRNFIRKTASSDLPVLIEGESGTGKELVAHAIHTESTRAKGSFIAINCGSMPKDLLENELFGHEKGAFTGATSEKRGLFELADKGTLFIDEIGEMDPASQVKLLRVLESGKFRRLGGLSEISSNVRIIAATNRVLESAIKEGAFRLDLYYRLSVLRLSMPPLRERKEDIPILIDHFIKLADSEKKLCDESLKLLKNYPWPGNIRELKNAINSAVVFSETSEIQINDFPEIIRKKLVEKPSPTETNKGLEYSSLKDFINSAEKEFFIRALEKYGDNKTEMARALNISRDMLYRKLKKYDIPF